MAVKLSSSFKINKNNSFNNVYYPKKNIKYKNEFDNFFNNIEKRNQVIYQIKIFLVYLLYISLTPNDKINFIIKFITVSYL